MYRAFYPLLLLCSYLVCSQEVQNVISGAGISQSSPLIKAALDQQPNHIPFGIVNWTAARSGPSILIDSELPSGRNVRRDTAFRRDGINRLQWKSGKSNRSTIGVFTKRCKRNGSDVLTYERVFKWVEFEMANRNVAFFVVVVGGNGKPLQLRIVSAIPPRHLRQLNGSEAVFLDPDPIQIEKYVSSRHKVALTIDEKASSDYKFCFKLPVRPARYTSNRKNGSLHSFYGLCGDGVLCGRRQQESQQANDSHPSHGDLNASEVMKDLERNRAIQWSYIVYLRDYAIR
jgi:hypothetical protein